MVEFKKYLDYRAIFNDPKIYLGKSAMKYLVIHSTANPESSALGHWQFWNSNPAQVNTNAHYIVDWDRCLQFIRDDWKANHVGGGNSISIGVELCETRYPDKFIKSLDNLWWITQHMMGLYPNLPVVSHDWMRLNVGGTTHRDPDEYLAALSPEIIAAHGTWDWDRLYNYITRPYPHARLHAGGFEFDGTNYISFPIHAALDLTDTLTIETWAKQKKNDTGYLVCKNNASDMRQYGLYSNGSSSIYFYYRTAAGAQSMFWNFNLADGDYHHLALVINYPDAELFVDGVSLGKQTMVGNMVSVPDANVVLGKRNPDTVYLDGILQDVKIYNRALNNGEVLTNMKGDNVVSNGLAANWKLLDTSGTTILDSGTNGIVGTVTGNSKWAIKQNRRASLLTPKRTIATPIEPKGGWRGAM